MKAKVLLSALLGAPLCLFLGSALVAPVSALAQPAPAAASDAPAPAPAASAAAPASTAAPAAPAPAAPAGGDAVPTAAPPADAMPVAPVAPVASSETPTALKHTCMDAINSDQVWTNELSALLQKKMRYDAHNSEAQLIAMNKRHVVMAYAVLWLIAVGFLFMQWRRQQGLKRQIESLQRELESAIKEPAK
jgi:hypothetical protein